jgi:hypothetical protein
MKKEFVPYELALELKQIGFDGESFGRFYTKPKCKMFGIDEKGRTYPMKNTSKKLYTIGEHCVLTEDNVIIAPLYQQAFRWFREKYSWQHSIDPTSDQHNFELGYNYWIWNNKTGEEYHTMPKNRPTGDWEYETYEEAELACLQKLIEIVKNK